MCNPFRVVLCGWWLRTRGGASLTPGYKLLNPFRVVRVGGGFVPGSVVPSRNRRCKGVSLRIPGEHSRLKYGFLLQTKVIRHNPRILRLTPLGARIFANHCRGRPPRRIMRPDRALREEIYHQLYGAHVPCGKLFPSFTIRRSPPPPRLSSFSHSPLKSSRLPPPFSLTHVAFFRQFLLLKRYV